MAAPLRRLEQRVEQFEERRDRRSFTRMMDALSEADKAGRWPRELDRRIDDAIITAAESNDWRLASAGLSELWPVGGYLRRKADAIARGLLSKCQSVRSASCSAISGLRLSRMILTRLEAMPLAEVMIWDVLMAVDRMVDELSAAEDRQRLVRFVQRMKRHGTRSPMVAWKIDDTLCCDLHLGLPREDDP